MDAETSPPHEPSKNATAPRYPTAEGDAAPWQRAPTTPRGPSPSDWQTAPPPLVAGAPTQPHRRGPSWFPWLVGGCLGTFVVLVLFCAVVAGTLGGLAFRIANRQEASETLSQSVSVPGTPTVSIESDVGAVRVVAGPDDQVHLAAPKTARAGSGADARRQVQRGTVLMRQVGESVTITSQTTGSNDFGVSLSTNLTVTVPHQTLLSLHLQSGDAEVDGVEGSLSAGIDHGGLRLSGVTLSGSC